MSTTSSHSSRVLSMASGTLASRLTGLLRVFVLVWVLGFTPLADAFNLANTIPNMLFDLVLGGIMIATYIPVFVERLAVDGERKAWHSISTVLTASVIALVIGSALAWIAAPWIIDGFTALHQLDAGRAATLLDNQRRVATELLRWFVPQIFFYGLIGLATALLNVRHRFGAPAWVPVANNVIAVAVLIWFHLVDPTPVLAQLPGSHDLLWLGLGTTLGVAVQFLCLLPSLARSDLWRVAPRFDRHDPALHAIARLGGWTLLVVVANQASLYVILALAFGVGGNGPVSAYTYGWSFFLIPYAVIVVSVLSSLAPQLSRMATDEDYTGFSERLRFGLRQSLVIIVPCTIGFIILSQPLVAVLNHVNATHTLAAGTVLAVLAAGMPGFTVYMLCVRGLQAMQRAREVFVLYLFQNGLNIVLALVFGRHSIAALTSSVSISYTVAAVAALFTLSRHHVSITTTIWSIHVRRSTVASLIAGTVMAATYAVSSANVGLGLIVRFASAFVIGVVAYVVVVVLGQRRAGRRPSNVQG